MDYKEPKTRKELKGNKSKDVYNQKAIRLKEALIEKNKDKNKDKNLKNK
jgi:hypothetical protein